MAGDRVPAPKKMRPNRIGRCRPSWSRATVTVLATRIARLKCTPRSRTNGPEARAAEVSGSSRCRSRHRVAHHSKPDRLPPPAERLSPAVAAAKPAVAGGNPSDGEAERGDDRGAAAPFFADVMARFATERNEAMAKLDERAKRQRRERQRLTVATRCVRESVGAGNAYVAEQWLDRAHVALNGNDEAFDAPRGRTEADRERWTQGDRPRRSNSARWWSFRCRRSGATTEPLRPLILVKPIVSQQLPSSTRQEPPIATEQTDTSHAVMEAALAQGRCQSTCRQRPEQRGHSNCSLLYCYGWRVEVPVLGHIRSHE